jgi:hemerythrin-like domain-containing protein
MTQPIRLQSLVASPAAGFEQPFEMLAACHERVLRMIALLQRLREHLRTHGADVQAQQAARDVVRYFDQAAPQHHRDEELHVFPPLLQAGDPRLAQVVRRLQEDHVRMDAQWQAARAVLLEIADARASSLSSAQEATLAGFAALHGEHLRAEEEIAYPAAQCALDEAARALMGQEMMRRRGVK